MGEVNIWFGLTTFLGGSILTWITAHFTMMRNSLTKESHKSICDDKQQIVAVQLTAINKQLAAHGEKLDRILLNGRNTK